MASKTLTPEEFVDALETWTVLDVVNAVKLMEDKLGFKPTHRNWRSAPRFHCAGSMERPIAEESWQRCGRRSGKSRLRRIAGATLVKHCWRTGRKKRRGIASNRL